ncbi:TlpA family protein disulfide reductase [Cohnella suwonensis]|uniref:TlpA family protein disulfide reductase n=1 Tax=Cohnella suwonensis TaxID=696072 RepID=A0ABW0M050_9BACL
MINRYLKKEKPPVLQRFEEETLKAGELLPDLTIQDENGTETNLHSYITDHLVLVLGSTGCDLCEQTLDALNDYTMRSSDLNVLILMDTHPAALHELRNIFNNRARIYIVMPHLMNRYLKMQYLPTAFCVGEDRRILSTHPFLDLESFQRLIEPLRTPPLSS